MRKDPGPMPYLQQALAIAAFEPAMYEVVRVFLPPAEHCRMEATNSACAGPP
jgi:hypothetical protein